MLNAKCEKGETGEDKYNIAKAVVAQHSSYKTQISGQGPHMRTLISQWFPELLPAVRTCPMITSETSSGFTRARLRTSLITTEHRSCRDTVDRAPLKAPVYKGGGGIILL